MYLRNEFMNLEGDKISTSEIGQFGCTNIYRTFRAGEDELRYTLIANMPENKDSEFTWQDFSEQGEQ